MYKRQLVRYTAGAPADSYTIPDSLTYIGDYAFNGCSNLTNINVDDDNAYYSSFDGHLFDKQMTTLIRYAAGAPADSYTIPDSVTYIDYGAFYGCTALASITIPDSVTEIGGIAFEGCPSLTSINVDDDNAYYSSLDGHLFDKQMTTLVRYAAGAPADSYTIPDSVTYIGDYAFNGCTALTSITIPDSITSIYGWTFGDCTGLASITIPDSVTYIDGGAFSGCSKLKNVYYTGTQEQWYNINIDMSYNESLENADIHFAPYAEYTKNEDGSLSLNISLPDNAVTDSSTIYVAGVSSTGELSSLELIPASSYEEIIISAEDIANIKIFVWDEFMRPLTVMKEIYIQ